MNNNTDHHMIKMAAFYDVAVPVYAVAIPLMITICLLSIFANVVVLISYKFLRDRLTPTLKLTLSLAGADAWTSLVIVVGLIANSYLPYVLHVPKWERQDCISYALEAFRLGGMVTSVFHLLTMSLNHYVATAYPVRYRIWSSGSWVVRCLWLVWLTPPVGFLIVFWLFADETFNAENCNSRFLDRTAFRLGVFVVIFGPLCLMTLVYAKIALVLRMLRRQARRRSNHVVSQQQQKTLHRKTRTIVTALLIVSTFLVGWVPGIALYATTCQSCVFPYNDLLKYPKLTLTLTIGVNSLMITKGLLNPLIYAVRIPEIRSALLSSFYFFCCCRTLQQSRRIGRFNDSTLFNNDSTLFNLSQRKTRSIELSTTLDESAKLYFSNDILTADTVIYSST